MVVVSPEADGFGFVQPDGGGGEVLFRDSSVKSQTRLHVGESVRYALANGSFALEAIDLRRSEVGGEDEKIRAEPALAGAL